MKWIAFLVVLSASSMAAPLPPSNLWLFELDNTSDKPEVISAQKLTDTQSYTSQPHFVRESNQLYYTQAFTSGGTEQTDAILYDIASGFHQNLTNSQESEYSPTPSPLQKGFSAIRVDAQNKQWLWEYSDNGEGLRKLIDIEPVGYHVWLSTDAVLAFVLGSPNTLQLITLSGHQRIIDEHIGPSLWPIPKTDMFSYSKNPAPTKQPWTLMAYDPQTKDSTVLVTLPAQAYYMAWTPEGKAITAVGSHLLSWDFTHLFPVEPPEALTEEQEATATARLSSKNEWNLWLDLSVPCPQGVSRAHLSHDSRYLAAICSE